MTQIPQNKIEEVNEEFYIHAMTLEKQWQESLIRFNDREWLAVFPESQSYLQYRLKKLKKAAKILTLEIQKDLRNIYKNIKDEFAIWFNEEIVRVWEGEDLNKLCREISKLKWLLSPEEQEPSRITELMIERAREYPFQDLIQSKRDFAICPFHSEKNPSFCIKNNWGYCFACGWHGDSIQFVMERDGLTFKEAIKRLNL